MKEEYREKLIAETRLREIESIDRDTTSLMFKIFFGFFAVIAFLWVQGTLSKVPFIYLAITIPCIIIYLLWIQHQSGRYIFDLYNGLAKAIKEKKVKDFEPHNMEWFEGIWYKKKY